MNGIFRLMYGSLAGKKKYQRLFEDLYKFSLQGMNIGGGTAPETSGEKHAIDYISRQLKAADNLVIFDVGANVGDYTILLQNVLKDRAHIFCFEPSKKTHEKLLSNTKHLNNIKQYNFGFGNDDAVHTLFSNADESGLASLYKRKLDHFNLTMDKTEEIEIKTIDGFCMQNNIPHIHFLKLDVEGNEMKILEGAKNMIASGNIDYIQFEFGGCNIDSRTYFQDFYYALKDRYNIYRIVKDGLYKLTGIKKYTRRLPQPITWQN